MNEEQLIPDVKLGYIFISKSDNPLIGLFESFEKIKDKDPLWIGISNLNPEYNTAISLKIEEMMPNVQYNIISNFEEIEDLYKIDQFLKNYKNGWTIVNIIGQELDLLAKEKLHKAINEKLDKFCLVVEDKEAEIPNVNNLLFFNFTYCFLKGNCPEYLEETNELVLKSILDKTREKGSDMIRNWSELS